jgi:hypothetical protein
MEEMWQRWAHGASVFDSSTSTVEAGRMAQFDPVWCDTLTGTNAWQPLTNLTLGPSPTVIQQPLTSTHRFCRGAWLP